MEFESALEVVGREQIRAAIAVEISGGHGACIRINFDDFESIKTKVARDLRVLRVCAQRCRQRQQQEGRDAVRSGAKATKQGV